MNYVVYAGILSNILNVLCCVLVFLLTQSWVISGICAILFLFIFKASLPMDILFPLGVLIYAILNFQFHWSFVLIGGLWLAMVALIIYGLKLEN